MFARLSSPSERRPNIQALDSLGGIHDTISCLSRVAIGFKASPDVLIGPRPIPETSGQQWMMNDGGLAPDISTSFASNTYLEIAENHPNPSPGRTDEMVRALADAGIDYWPRATRSVTEVGSMISNLWTGEVCIWHGGH